LCAESDARIASSTRREMRTKNATMRSATPTRPSESSAAPVAPRALPLAQRPSGMAARPEFRIRRSNAVMGSAFPLRRWHLPRPCGFPSADRGGHSQAAVAPSQRVPPSAKSRPARPSQRAAACRLLSWASAPFSTCKARRSTVSGHAGPLSSARRVWLPSRRLTPSAPGPALFHAGGALGIRPSELPPPDRYRERFRPGAPTCRFSRRYSRPDCSRRAGPASRGFWGFTLPERPWRPVRD